MQIDSLNSLYEDLLKRQNDLVGQSRAIAVKIDIQKSKKRLTKLQEQNMLQEIKNLTIRLQENNYSIYLLQKYFRVV